ncbi:MAG: hypothetical protein F4213_16615 [Boseongicola sp. SB0677_bin_26]|nr:hypothetical protein [Boseongicola sp. SB0665_bin_10]MYG27615.1 hypothetical protein [Boseongicola sp. SB0677_bin_26]
MSDSRWLDADRNVRSAIQHFSMALKIWGNRHADKDQYDQYVQDAALMHAMQSGHTSFENAMLNILGILDETPPSGESWHQELIRRVSEPAESRPSVLDAKIARAATRTRAFRHVASRGYDAFEIELGAPAMDAARILINGLPEAVANFRNVTDPPSSDDKPKRRGACVEPVVRNESKDGDEGWTPPEPSPLEDLSDPFKTS